MIEIRKCNKEDYPALEMVWERSVRTTHDFLADEDIKEIKSKLSSLYFPNVMLKCSEVNGVITGFIGTSDRKIEMLFVDSVFRGKGYGSMLLADAIKSGMTLVDVNEQNPSAFGFYMAKGFGVVARSETDEAGRPFPILHLSL